MTHHDRRARPLYLATSLEHHLAGHQIRDRAAAELEWIQRVTRVTREERYRKWAATYERVMAGAEPAEVLPPELVEDLVGELVAEGQADADIARCIRLSTYTVARIRRRLQLHQHDSPPAHRLPATDLPRSA